MAQLEASNSHSAWLGKVLDLPVQVATLPSPLSSVAFSTSLLPSNLELPAAETSSTSS